MGSSICKIKVLSIHNFIHSSPFISWSSYNAQVVAPSMLQRVVDRAVQVKIPWIVKTFHDVTSSKYISMKSVKWNVRHMGVQGCTATFHWQASLLMLGLSHHCCHHSWVFLVTNIITDPFTNITIGVNKSNTKVIIIAKKLISIGLVDSLTRDGCFPVKGGMPFPSTTISSSVVGIFRGGCVFAFWRLSKRFLLWRWRLRLWRWDINFIKDLL